MIRIILITIILLFPLAALAHEGEVHLAVDPTALPGERGYFFERIGEWIEVNLLTLSTKQKQEKKLKLSDERVAEVLALLEQKEVKKKNLETAWRRYEGMLLEAEYTAEKIIFLDGAEIALAEKLEEATRLHEQVLAQALGFTDSERRSIVFQALNFARTQNETIFKFMVKNYQANDSDIQKHRDIIEAHIQMTDSRIDDSDITPHDRSWAKFWIKEARKFQKAGLNIEAYDYLKKAKHVLYSTIDKEEAHATQSRGIPEGKKTQVFDRKTRGSEI